MAQIMLLATIINKFRDSFFRTYNKNLLPGHIKALESMARCRYEHGPHMLARCSDHRCGERVYTPHSCGHRNCLHCQNHESQQWLESKLDKRLPCQYYLIPSRCPACGAAMVIAATMIARPSAMAAQLQQ